MATPLTPLKIQVTHLNFHHPHKSPHIFDKFLDFLHRIEIYAILAYFCLNLVAIATRLAPLKV